MQRLSRRDVLRCGAAAAAGGLAPIGSGATGGYPSPPRSVRNRIVAKLKTAISGLHDSRWYIRKRYLQALRLVETAPESVVTAVCDVALNDPDAEVRWTAVRVLGDMRAETAVPTLLVATQEKNMRVREEATLFLEFIRFCADHPPDPFDET